MSTRHEDHDEDQDSLFGSPPPSPRLSTGRPASPALALPCAPGSSTCTSGRRSSISTAHAAIQNVGTIALPGSQPDSELPISPLALSLNLGIVHRPPAQLSPAAAASSSLSSIASTSASATQGNCTWQKSVAGPSAPAGPSRTLHSRSATPSTLSSSTRPANKPSKKRTRPSSRANSNEPPPEQRGPEFPLPDPSAPPPSHFLRNQGNLLGKAGVVAGVKPSTITHTRGSTPSNPIVVEEEGDTPKLGRRHGGFARPYIDPSLLTAPTNQEIVSVLIGQKDIFPILEGVLKLVVGNAAATVGPRPTAFQSKAPYSQSESRQSTPADTTSGSENPPLKKRKLNRVPAGAVDWDVPYPFKEGEGPDAYDKTWERERGKRLISQLIQQIKTAARKAATKKYLQQQNEKQMMEEEERRQNTAHHANAQRKRSTGHYRPVTATYGLSEEEKKKVYDVLQDASNALWVSKAETSSQSQNTVSPRPEQTTAITRPSPTPSNVELQGSMTPTFEQLTNSYIASMQSTAIQGQDTVNNAANTHFTFQDQSSSNTAFLSSSAVDPSQSSSSSPTGLDQFSFDSWLNHFLQTMPPSSFEFSSSQLGDFSSTSTSAPTSHCSTPAPSGSGSDDFTFGNIPPPNADDMSTLFNSIFNQPPPADNTFDPNFLSNANFNFDNLDIKFPSMDGDATSSSNTPATEAASPIPSASSFTGTSTASVNDPATPASAAWEISLPDVHMVGSSSIVGGGGGDASGQGWDPGMSVDEPMQDFGILPEPEIMHKEADPSARRDVENSGNDMVKVDKGKGKAIGPFPEAMTWDTMSLPPVTSKEAAFRALMGAPLATITPTPQPTSTQTSTPGPSLPFTTAQVPTASTITPSTRTTPAPPTTRELRKQRKDDIIKRAREKRQRMQEELDEVKKQLWATTVEQAGLLLMLRKVEEGEMGEASLGEGEREGPGLVSVSTFGGAPAGVS